MQCPPFTEELIGKRILLLCRPGYPRDLLAAHLTGKFRCTVDQAGDGDTALRLAADHRPDIAVIELALFDHLDPSDFDGLAGHLAPAPLVALVDDTHRNELSAAIASGVVGVIGSDFPVDRVDLALSAVACGETFLPADYFRPSAARPSGNAALSRKEMAVLAELSTGCTNSDIAQRLGLSLSTVKMHVSSVLRKTRSHNRAQAAARARSGGLLA